MMRSCDFVSNSNNLECGKVCGEIRGKSVGFCEMHWRFINIHQYLFSHGGVLCATCGSDNAGDFVEIDQQWWPRTVCSVCYYKLCHAPSLEMLKNYSDRIKQIQKELLIEQMRQE